MKLKPAILSVLGRDDLKHIVDDLEIGDVDRRSVEDMRAALSRARRVKAADLLWHMRKDQIKEVCELVGVSADIGASTGCTTRDPNRVSDTMGRDEWAAGRYNHT